MKRPNKDTTAGQPLTPAVVSSVMDDADALLPEVYDPEADRAEVLKPVRSMRTYLRRLLNEDGSYKRKYNQQLKLTAQALMLLEDCYLEIMKAKSESRYVSTETSREGNARKSTSALVKTYIRLDAMARKNLAALGMNMERYARTPGPGDGNDALDALLQDLNS